MFLSWLIIQVHFDELCKTSKNVDCKLCCRETLQWHQITTPLRSVNMQCFNSLLGFVVLTIVHHHLEAMSSIPTDIIPNDNLARLCVLNNRVMTMAMACVLFLHMQLSRLSFTPQTKSVHSAGFQSVDSVQHVVAVRWHSCDIVHDWHEDEQTNLAQPHLAVEDKI